MVNDLFSGASKGKNDWWRYLLGIGVVILFYFLGQMFLYGVLLYQYSEDPLLGQEALSRFERSMDFKAVGIDKNLGFVLLIMMFVVALSGLYLVVKYIHKKRFLSLITPQNTLAINKILFGFGLWLLLSLALEGINYLLSPESYTFRWNPSGYIPLLVISVFMLPVQTSFEELFFRGYLMQGMSIPARNKWVPVLISSIIFGLVHGTNPEVAKYGFWTMQVYYIIAGLFLAVITVMDDSLELALGVHAATNFFGATLFTYEGGVLQTDSLFTTTEIRPWLMTVGFVAAAAVFIFICTRKYKWPSLSYLLGRIDTLTAETA